MAVVLCSTGTGDCEWMYRSSQGVSLVSRLSLKQDYKPSTLPFTNFQTNISIKTTYRYYIKPQMKYSMETKIIVLHTINLKFENHRINATILFPVQYRNSFIEIALVHFWTSPKLLLITSMINKTPYLDVWDKFRLGRWISRRRWDESLLLHNKNGILIFHFAHSFIMDIMFTSCLSELSFTNWDGLLVMPLNVYIPCYYVRECECFLYDVHSMNIYSDVMTFGNWSQQYLLWIWQLWLVEVQ